MKLDIRLPLGLMFAIFGIILVAYGYLSAPEIYEKSLGMNVNLWWGGVLAIFGLAFLAPLFFSAQRKD